MATAVGFAGNEHENTPKRQDFPAINISESSKSANILATYEIRNLAHTPEIDFGFGDAGADG